MTNSMFDDIVLKARDLCDTASKKTGEIYEVSKYKYECIRLNGEIRKLYEQLGSSVYSMFKSKFDNQELIESLTEEIDEHLDRLRDINAILTNLQKVVVCAVCGAKNSPDNCYCSKCGSKLKEECTCNSCGCEDAADSCECKGSGDSCKCEEPGDSCECGCQSEKPADPTLAYTEDVENAEEDIQ